MALGCMPDLSQGSLQAAHMLSDQIPPDLASCGGRFREFKGRGCLAVFVVRDRPSVENVVSPGGMVCSIRPLKDVGISGRVDQRQDIFEA